MQIDTSKVPYGETEGPLPEGNYTCRVAKVEKFQRTRGYPIWKLRLEIEEGEHAGRVIFDCLALSRVAKCRVEWICHRFGLITSRAQALTPEHLVGRDCFVHVGVEDYID